MAIEQLKTAYSERVRVSRGSRRVRRAPASRPGRASGQSLCHWPLAVVSLDSYYPCQRGHGIAVSFRWAPTDLGSTDVALV